LWVKTNRNLSERLLEASEDSGGLQAESKKLKEIEADSGRDKLGEIGSGKLKREPSSRATGRTSTRYGRIRGRIRA